MADTIHVLIPSAGGPIPGIWYPVAHAPGALVMVAGDGRWRGRRHAWAFRHVCRCSSPIWYGAACSA